MKISLAQWSLHRAIQSGAMRSMDFPGVARRDFGIEAIELVSGLMKGSTREDVADLRRAARAEGMRVLLIMVDDEGDLSHPDRRRRKKAARNHRRWVDAAAALGCHAVRVNTGGERTLPGNVPFLPAGSPVLRAAIARCAESCADLADYARAAGVSVCLENHGGLSANIPALLAVIEAAARMNLGTLPDFGNFASGIDRYESVRQMLPFARALSAKSFDFAEDGTETTIDYPRMMGLAREAGYSGHVGIEYEGTRLPEADGIRRTKALLERCIIGALSPGS